MRSLTERNPPGPLRSVDLAASMRLLVLNVLCCDIDPSLIHEMRPSVEALRRRIEAARERDLYAVDGPSAVLAALALARVEGACTPLLSGYLSTVARTLAGEPSDRDSSSARIARLVAARLGRCEMPPAERLRVDVASLLGGGEASLQDALVAIDRASSCGTSQIEPMPDVAHWLECAALNALQRYRLDWAGDIVRRAKYVGGRTGLCSTQIGSFMAAHQTPTGEFGFHDGAIAAMLTHAPEPYASLSVQLPATLACLWYFAERDLPDYRMIRDLGSGAA